MQNVDNLLMAALVVGVGATLVMDLWAFFLRRIWGIPSLDYCLVGRWVAYMQQGVFRHVKISAAEARSGECALGWGIHYVIGIVYAGIVILPHQGVWLHWQNHNPAYALGAALVLGWVTVLVPFFIMQPALGFGIAAAKNPKPYQARLKTFITHSVFGLGLYVAGYVYQMLLLSVK